MLEEVTAEDVARAIRIRHAVGAHHVGEIGIGIERILPIADASDGARGRRARRCRAAMSSRLLQPRILRRDPSRLAPGCQRSSDVTGRMPYGCAPQRSVGNGPKLRT